MGINTSNLQTADDFELGGIKSNGRYNAVQSAALIGISPRAFFRIVQSGKIKKHFTEFSTRPYYRGIDLMRLINLL